MKLTTQAIEVVGEEAAEHGPGKDDFPACMPEEHRKIEQARRRTPGTRCGQLRAEPDQRLRHLIGQARRPLLDVLLDPGLGARVRRPRLAGGLVEVLKQVVDGLLILLVHTGADTPEV